MVFSSHIFLFYFLPLALLVYYNLPYRWRNAFLALASYIFYGWWRPWFVLLMMTSTVLDWFWGRVIASPRSGPLARRLAVAASVVGNLSILGFFKYYMFSAESLNTLLSLVGAETYAVLRVTLPIGISFYTFQTISYVVDVYRGDARAARSLVDYACFVSLFPQLIAGPIIRYHTVAEQLTGREHTPERFASGVAIFILGLGKKVLLANPMGEMADAAFGAHAPMAMDAWVGVTAYAMQIYFDFCGYSDMAVGLGRMLGFEFIKNFNAPYRADSITELWRRWHISLSTFLRDYLYIPLGGNRKGPARTYLNLAIVMLLGGLWHGARWTFVLWGAYHGLLLAYERWRGRDRPGILPRAAGVAFTFLLMLCSWVLFRCEDLPSAIAYYGAMFGLAQPAAAAPLLAGELYTPMHLALLGLCLVLVFQPLQAHDWVCRGRQSWLRAAILLPLFVLALAAMFSQAFQPFLYFQF
jgi:alginate O-acetyltransferase complex protein AlgI